MNARPPSPRPAASGELPIRPLHLLLLGVLLLPGCAPSKVAGPGKENERPTVQFTRAPSRSGDLYSYQYEMSWIGFDPDGEVAGFLYCVDPPVPTAIQPEPDTLWTRTTSFRESFQFDASQPVPGTPPRAADYHTFVLKSVDDRGLASLPAVVTFNAATVAPTVRIVSPVPSDRNRTFLPPNFRVTWEGFDVDGVTTQKPVSYRVKLFGPSSPFTPAIIQNRPDTLAKHYAPLGWATWDSLGADATTYNLNALTPGQDMAFVVIAFDEAGAYTPMTLGTTNVLQFRPTFASSSGPLLTVFNDFVDFTYSQAVYLPNDPRYEIFVEVPAGSAVTFNWIARVSEDTYVRYYRWVMDPENLDDSTPRTNERTDVTHWSTPNTTVRSATLGPFASAGEHKLYIEAGDGNGLRSLAVVRFRVVTPIFDRELGIADDTRFLVDRRTAGSVSCIDRPLGRFPTAAELDTFLYARGGFPIRCYPAGSVSRTGLFAGYAFDTLNMRPGVARQTPSLATLSRYRRLIWLVNSGAIDNYDPGTDISDGMTTMRYMNQPGQFNALAAYLRQGGELWLAGGGAISAAVVWYNTTANDRPARIFSAAAGELRPGRFVYDFVRWRSEIRPTNGVFQIRRNFGRFGTSPPGPYALFPDRLQAKSLALGDTLPAWRTVNGDFFVTVFDVETITAPNSILEDQNPDPDIVEPASVLDTLYNVSGGTLPAGSAVMTVYHGAESPRVIATGFDLWSYNRGQLRQVVDGVLNGIWGLTRR